MTCWKTLSSGTSNRRGANRPRNETGLKWTSPKPRGSAWPKFLFWTSSEPLPSDTTRPRSKVQRRLRTKKELTAERETYSKKVRVIVARGENSLVRVKLSRYRSSGRVCSHPKLHSFGSVDSKSLRSFSSVDSKSLHSFSSANSKSLPSLDSQSLHSICSTRRLKESSFVCSIRRLREPSYIIRSYSFSTGDGGDVTPTHCIEINSVRFQKKPRNFSEKNFYFSFHCFA